MNKVVVVVVVSLVLERKALLVASQFTEQKSDFKTRTKEISLKNTENSKALFP